MSALVWYRCSRSSMRNILVTTPTWRSTLHTYQRNNNDHHPTNKTSSIAQSGVQQTGHLGSKPNLGEGFKCSWWQSEQDLHGQCLWAPNVLNELFSTYADNSEQPRHFPLIYSRFWIVTMTTGLHQLLQTVGRTSSNRHHHISCIQSRRHYQTSQHNVRRKSILFSWTHEFSPQQLNGAR